MENKLLLVVDPQIDFITGSLAIPGAEKAMDSLAEYLRGHKADYRNIVVTADRHPMNHCSFKSEGGKWPVHCVADSVGAAIWPPVMNELIGAAAEVTVMHKGEEADTEEYSIFKNRSAAEKILNILTAGAIDRIDVCGLAGDVCVADTVHDAVALDLHTQINVLTGFSPSLDGGKTLDSLISDYGLSSGI
ncbi:MAG: isochorismatase family protein [Bacteroides sp.]|nr:isochorismatase family protein [Bacteroides sp.]